MHLCGRVCRDEVRSADDVSFARSELGRFRFLPGARAPGYILTPLRGSWRTGVIARHAVARARRSGRPSSITSSRGKDASPDRLVCLKRFSTLRHNRRLGEDALDHCCVSKTHIRAGEAAVCFSRQAPSAQEAALHAEV